MVEQQKAWKFATLGSLAILAISLSIPQAAAHITNNTQHMLAHIYNFVEGINIKTENLPTDPADQSLLDEQLASIQSDTNELQTEIEGLSSSVSGPKSLGINLNLDVPDDQVRAFNLLPNTNGAKTYSGHITGVFFMDNLQRGEIRCKVGSTTGASDLPLAQAEDFVRVQINHDFTCYDLYVFVQDKPGESNTDNNHLIATVQYSESEDISHITN